ncbi:hypothetical protein [Tenacibaculum amylolyticum]|uniref:hypothetical protein n=1 Tax=Tenacibaculum amylolyticum TaxID=104269 RepID=UPI003894C01D
MKSIKFLLAIMFIAISTNVLANNTPTDDKDRKWTITKDIQKLLKQPNFPVEKTMFVTVKLTVNKNNEIVVLSVDTDGNKDLVEGYIKARLNYKKLSKSIRNTVYTLPVKMVSL